MLEAGCLPMLRAVCTHSIKDSIAPQKTAGSLSSGFHHSDWNICSCVSDLVGVGVGVRARVGVRVGVLRERHRHELAQPHHQRRDEVVARALGPCAADRQSG